MEAFDSARETVARLGINADSVRLNISYTFKLIICIFENNTQFYILLKRDTTIIGKKKWYNLWGYG